VIAIAIRPLEARDLIVWAALRKRLWPGADFGELVDEARTFLTEPEASLLAAGFIAEAGEDAPLGFIELTIRAFSDGCDSMPVPHIEGWYVEPPARRNGAGRALVAAAEAWCRERGFTELASDTEVHNVDSQRAHEQCGFAEVDRLVKFRKPLR
jgi:aminoglycoside 6'-N-acetyltransferase I